MRSRSRDGSPLTAIPGSGCTGTWTTICEACHERVESIVRDGRLGRGGGSSPRGNNGWGNGENFAPGNSLDHQPKFEDPNTGPTPCHGPNCSGGDR